MKEFPLKQNQTLLTIGIIEILIGALTLLANFNTLNPSSIIKPINVSCFVLITSVTSILLGIGILQLNKNAYNLLLYFSSVIVLSKLLIFMNIIELNGALQTAIPTSSQNIISVIYHLGIIFHAGVVEWHTRRSQKPMRVPS